MHLDFTDEQDTLRESVAEVLARHSPPSLLRALAETGDRSGVDALWDQMVALDWPALTVPEEHGGLGLGFVELAVVAEELGRVAAPGPLLPTLSQFLPLVREDPELLAAVAAGQVKGAGAFEPGAVVEAEHADVVALDAGDRVLVFERDALQVEPVRTFDPTRAVARVRWEEGDASRTLPHPGPGAREEATAALALEMVGTCQALFDMTLAYAKEREQFGRPIGSFQALKHKLADMLVALERARATAYFAAVTIAEGDRRRSVAVSTAKAAAGDCQRLVCQEAIQIHGGIGYTWEHDLHLYVKRAKSGDALLGSASSHRQRLADAAFAAATAGDPGWAADGR